MKELFDQSSYKSSKIITELYSSSFSMGIKLFSKSIRTDIYAIYGFVRFADEIVDTFHDYDQELLFNEFQDDYHKALDRKISMNVVLNAFQQVVHKNKLQDLVEHFMHSMRMDLEKKKYHSEEEYKQYIYGSADVIGLMCLKVFVNGDEEKFNALKTSAMHLGSAFQKVNFLRDIKNDIELLGRSYFPNLKTNVLDDQTKAEIIQDIEHDFNEAYKGILKLPTQARLGVYVAYRYYCKLLMKLKVEKSAMIMKKRIRVADHYKLFLLFKSYIRFKLNLM